MLRLICSSPLLAWGLRLGVTALSVAWPRSTSVSAVAEGLGREWRRPDDTSQVRLDLDEVCPPHSRTGRRSKSRTSKSRASKGRTSKGRASKGRASKGRTSKGRASKGRASKGRASKGRSSKGRASKGRASKGRTSKGRTQYGRPPKSRSTGAGGSDRPCARDQPVGVSTHRSAHCRPGGMARGNPRAHASSDPAGSPRCEGGVEMAGHSGLVAPRHCVHRRVVREGRQAHVCTGGPDPRPFAPLQFEHGRKHSKGHRHPRRGEGRRRSVQGPGKSRCGPKWQANQSPLNPPSPTASIRIKDPDVVAALHIPCFCPSFTTPLAGLVPVPSTSMFLRALPEHHARSG